MKKISDRLGKAPERITAAPDSGLTSAQALERRGLGFDNQPPEPPSKTVGEIIADNVFTYFNLIFFILAGFIIYAGTYRDLMFMPIIIANTLIGIFQELRSKSVLDKLNMMNAPVTAVIRNGSERKIPSKDVVLDDIAVFRAGDQISADAVVIDGNATVNESLLTGESDEISKKNGDTLMSGSFVVSGCCKARLEHVGADSYISKLTIQAKKIKKGERSEMIRSLNRIVKIAGILIIPIGISMFCHQHLLEHISVSGSIQAMVASVLGMIPEGLFLLASTTLAISTIRLARDRVLVHDMKCIEALARVDTLCVDKTGTITESKMTVISTIPIGKTSEDKLFGLISDFAAAQSSDNATMLAVKEHFSRPTGRKPTAVSGFSSEFKYSGAAFEDGAFVLGAPEFLLGDAIAEHREMLREHSQKGERVLAFCRYTANPDGKRLTGDTEALGFVIIANPIREGAPETFRFLAQQGVEIKVISGDDPVTVSEIAKQAGIADAERYIDVSTLADDDLTASATEYTVFGRVTPEQKRKLVRALKSAGRTVAMTGDGVNDVLALKDADCSVAMASGSEAASQAAQLVLLDSDFTKMPDVVMEGRRVVNNLERSGSLFLVKNIFTAVMAVLVLFAGLTYPLKPANLSLVSMFTIGIPGFLLSQIPNRELIRGKFMRKILLRALPAGSADVVAVTAMVIVGRCTGMMQETVSTASAILMWGVGMVMLLWVSKPMNRVKWAIWLGSGTLAVLSMIFAGGFFGLQ